MQALSECTNSITPAKPQYQRWGEAQAYLDAAYTNDVARQTVADYINRTWPQDGVIVTASAARARASRTGATASSSSLTDPRNKTRRNPDSDDEEVLGVAPKRLRRSLPLPLPLSPPLLSSPISLLSSPISGADLDDDDDDDLSWMFYSSSEEEWNSRDFQAQVHPMYATASSSEEEDSPPCDTPLSPAY